MGWHLSNLFLPRQAIIGVGINIITPPDLQNLDQAVTSLSELGLHNRSRIELIHDIYVAIQQAGAWFNHGCYNLAERFNHVAMFKGQSVSFEHQQGVAEGIFLGIQNDGGILCLIQHRGRPCIIRDV